MADEGAEEADWDAKAQQLRENRSSCEFTGEDVRNRWTQIVRRHAFFVYIPPQRACGMKWTLLRRSCAPRSHFDAIAIAGLLFVFIVVTQAPRVKEELKKQDEQRACGHT